VESLQQNNSAAGIVIAQFDIVFNNRNCYRINAGSVI